MDEAGVMTKDEIAYVKNLVKDIATVVSEDFASKGLHVVDGKFELGRLRDGDGKIVLIDEVSPDVLRVCRGYTPDEAGNCSVYKECITTSCAGDKRTIKAKNQLKAAALEEIFLS